MNEQKINLNCNDKRFVAKLTKVSDNTNYPNLF